MKTVTERRQFRRAEIDVVMTMRPVAEGEEASAEQVVVEGHIKNVGLAGVLCHVTTPCPLKTGQTVTCSIVVPPEQARLFPFTRLHGKGWVVRIAPVAPGRRAGDAGQGEQLLGVAVAFAPDVTALGTLEYQF